MRLSDDTKQLITEAEIRAQDAKFRDTTNSTAVTNGAVVIDGGMGIAKDIVIGGNIVGDSASNLSGFDSITATSFTGNGANLTNTGAELSASGTNGDTQRVTLTHLTTGTMTAATTDAQLTFTSSTNTLACTTFDGALSGNATSSSTSANLSFGSANQVVFKNGSNNGATSSNLTFNGTQLNCTNNIRANNITLGLTAGTTINTATGDLVLDSSNNKVHITANAEVDGSMTIDSSTDSSSKDTGCLLYTSPSPRDP